MEIRIDIIFWKDRFLSERTCDLKWKPMFVNPQGN